MRKTARAAALLLALALAFGMLPFAGAEAVTLKIILAGEKETPEGTQTVPLEGSFRVWQNGREQGTIRAGQDTMLLDSGERVRVEPLPETISPGWDLTGATRNLDGLKTGSNEITIVLKPLSAEAARNPVTATVASDVGQDADSETEKATEETGEGTAQPTETPAVPDGEDGPVPAAYGMATPTLGPTPEPTPAPTAEPELPGLVGGDNTGSLLVNVFLDKNGNGEQGPYEVGVSGVKIYAEDENGTPVAMAESNGDGEALFENLPAGNYRLRVWAPEGRCFSKKGKHNPLSSSCTGLTPEPWALSDPITVRAGGTAERGVGLMGSVRISGFCWLETLADGICSSGEQLLPGVRITLDGIKNELHYEAVSDSNGYYVFDHVRPGGYTLTAYTPDGMMFTRYSAQGGNNRSIITREGATKGSKTIEVSDGTDKTQENIGFVWAGSISGRCFLDANYNGLYDEGELPMPGVRISVTKPSAEKPLATVTSGEDGTYTIPSLRGSTYKVRVLLPDDGSDFSKAVSDPLGNHFEARSGRRENFWNDFILADMEQREMNVGVIYPSTVSGTVYMDNDFSGTLSGKEKIVSGFQVTLADVYGNPIASDKTNIKGVYEIPGVVPGEYTLTATALDGYAFTKTGEGNVMLNLTGGAGISAPFRVELGTRVPGMDLGMILPGTVEGTVFADRNDDGMMDPGENGLAGVVVRLMGEEGEAFSTLIGEDGHFLFDAVMPGRYYLEYTLPEGAIFARVPNAISGGNTVTGENSVGRGSWFDFTTGAKVTAPLCGALTLGRITGTAFRDSDGDGIRSAEEETLEGLTLVLTPSRRDLDPMTATSGADGAISITEIHPDTWTLEAICPDGTVLSRTDGLTLPLKPGKAEQESELAVAMGQCWDGQPLGCVTPAGLEGVLWLDENDNGLMDEGEQTPAGWQVTVTDERTGKIFDVLTTDENGAFETSGMIPGSFTVSMELTEDTTAPKEGDSTFRSEGGRLVMSGISLGEGDHRSDLKLGIVRYTRMGGTVWIDRGGTVEPLAGAQVILKDGSGTELVSATTGANGAYEFTKLMPGTYSLDTNLPEGCVVVEPEDTRLASGRISIMTVTNRRHGESEPIQLVMGEDLTELDIGCVLPGRVGDLCWLDENGDGLQGMGEYGIPGVKIELLRDGTAIAETESDQYGFWRFSDVYPAEYTLRVTPPQEVKPTVKGSRPAIIASVLNETDEEESLSDPVQVESDRANYNADLGFVCRKPGVTPPRYGQGETQDWSKSAGSEK